MRPSGIGIGAHARHIARQENITYEAALRKGAKLLLRLLRQSYAARAARVEATLPERRSPRIDLQVEQLLGRFESLSPKQLRLLLGCTGMSLSRALHRLNSSGRLVAKGSTRDRNYRLVVQRTGS